MGYAINWLEIPARDFERAVAFYEGVFGQPVQRGDFLGVPHGFLPGSSGTPIGAIIAAPLVEGGDVQTGHAGPVLYLDAGGQIDAIVERVETGGGRVLAPPTSINQTGQIAIFLDSEGNRVGLHQSTQ